MHHHSLINFAWEFVFHQEILAQCIKQLWCCVTRAIWWVFSTASMTCSTYIGMELMAYIVVKSRALPVPLANLLLCEIALHA